MTPGRGVAPRAAFAALAAFVALAGCVSPEPPTEAADVEAAPPAEAPAAAAAVDAPALPVGRAWTYAASGEWDAEATFTVVVAESSPRGLLLAAAREEDLPTQVAWGRPWFGWRDEDLNARPSEHEPDVDRLFDFPLEDGRTWTSKIGRVVARAAEVETPLGPRPGFTMEARDGELVARWTYAPDVGFLTSFRLARGERVLMHATLTDVGARDAWVWYEPGPAVEVEGNAAAALEVPHGMDAVAGNAGGAGRALAVVRGPGAGAPWTWQPGDAYGNVAVLLPAAPGSWTATTAAAPDAEAYLRLAAVRWVRSE